MNSIRQIADLNRRELELAVPPSASWHADYRDTAYIHIASLPYTLTEGDLITIFSQFGEPVWVKLARDKETGKSRGFGWLKYEDQRSCDLAVDNLSGAEVVGRRIGVDHARYKRREGEEEEEEEGRRMMERVGEGMGRGEEESEGEREVVKRPLLKEEVELQKLLVEHDDDDPMKEYLVQQKREEVEKALKALKVRDGKDKKDRKHKHRSRRDDRDEPAHPAKTTAINELEGARRALPDVTEIYHLIRKGMIARTAGDEEFHLESPNVDQTENDGTTAGPGPLIGGTKPGTDTATVESELAML